MPSIRCAHCNLLNFDTEPACKRCRQPLGSHAAEPAFANMGAGYGQAPPVRQARQQVSQQPAARQTATSYYEPPPPNYYEDIRAGNPAPAGGGYNRTVTISIPPVCVKCGSGHGLEMKKFKKDYTPPAAYLGFLAGGILPLLIVILLCRKIHKMNGLFCSECWNRYRPHSVISTLSALTALVMMFIGIIIGVAADSPLLGFGIFFAALGLAIWGNHYAKKVAPAYVKTNRKQVYINIPNYGEVDFTHSAL